MSVEQKILDITKWDSEFCLIISIQRIKFVIDLGNMPAFRFLFVLLFSNSFLARTKTIPVCLKSSMGSRKNVNSNIIRISP